MSASIRLHGDVELKDALVLVAFPTTGLVASTAGRFLVQQFGLPLVGSFHLEGATPVISVEEGIATTPIRLYGGEVACNLDGPCPHLVVVQTELQLADGAMHAVAEAILGWAKENGAAMILSLEGVVREEGDDIPDVFVVASDPKSLGQLTKSGVPPLRRAILGGVTAAILERAGQTGVAAGSMVVEATKDAPDGHAAVALLKALNTVIPHSDVDTEPLEKEVAELEQELRRATQQGAPTARSPPGHTFI